jgi:hypothetical protein
MASRVLLISGASVIRNKFKKTSCAIIEVMIFHPIQINGLKICRGYGVTVIDQVGCSPLVPKAVSTMIVCFGSLDGHSGG